MPETKIRLRDGIVDDNGNRISRLKLRVPLIQDALLMPYANKMPGAIRLLSSLSGVSESALSTMTMDDATDALERVIHHLRINDPSKGRRL